MSTLSTILAAVLGIALLAAAIARLSGWQKMADDFERWGYPPALLAVTALVELLAALLLLAGIALPALAISGALLATFVMIAALVAHRRAKDPLAGWGPPAVLLVLAVVLLVSMLPEG